MIDLNELKEKYFNLLNWLRGDKSCRIFIEHNKKIFSSVPNKKADKFIVLLELNDMHSSIIAYSYLANVLSSFYGAEIIAYVPDFPTSWKRMLAWHMRRRLNMDVFAIYKSFGTKGFLLPTLNKKQCKKAECLFKGILENLKTISDVESVVIDGVHIGDLIYDSYLKYYERPTIEINDKDFHVSLFKTVKLFVFWQDYIKNHNVSAINVSHCVYNTALPVRIAINEGVSVFQANATHVYRLSKKNNFAYNDVKYYKERFSALPVEVRDAGLKVAERRINERFSGKIGIDMSYSTKSAYGEFKEERLIAKSDRKKILIAAHCFFDSPHSYGVNLFPDFYEWLDFLGSTSEETDYDWYIKTHPDYVSKTKEIIELFVSKYKKFNLLPSDSSHNQIIKEGIDVALSVYGTIGFEYAAQGIPVINASLNNPHIAYNFNLHPRSIEEYKKILVNLENLSLTIDKKDVYEYYFMKNIYNTEDWLFSDYAKMIKDVGGYREQFSSKVYAVWLHGFNVNSHQETIKALSKFVESEDFRLNHHHSNRKFNMKKVA